MSEASAQATDLERGLLEHAHELALRGQGLVSPNPLVGAVVLRGDEVLGEGWHLGPGTDHAEVMALTAARASGEDPRGATVICTLEPCSHHGRTPPCTKALIEAGVARVVVGSLDPLERGRPGGTGILRDAAIEVVLAPEEDQEACRALNHAFITHSVTGRPHVTLKMATSLDGRVATETGETRWITGAEARAFVHQSRAAADAVAVGIGTAIADDPELTVRDIEMSYRPPIRVVFDRTGRLPLSSRLVATAAETPLLVVVGPEADARAVAALQQHDVGVMVARDIDDALTQLGAAEVQSLYVEGGPTLAAAFLAAGAVDWVDWFVAPILIGGDGAPTALAGAGLGPLAQVPRLQDVASFDLGDDTLIAGRLRELPR